MGGDAVWWETDQPPADPASSGVPGASAQRWSRPDPPLDLRPYDRWAALRADTNRFGLLGRLLITLAVWIIPGAGLWTMALHPGTVFFAFAFAWLPALAAVALYISIAVWRK